MAWSKYLHEPFLSSGTSQRGAVKLTNLLNFMFWWKLVNFSILRIKIFPLNSWVFLPLVQEEICRFHVLIFFFLLYMNRPGNIFFFSLICTGINILKAGSNSSPGLGPGGGCALTHPQDILDIFQRSQHHHQVPCLWAIAGWRQKGPK